MGDYTSCDQYRKGKSITERECTVPRLSVRHKWVTDLSKMLAEKLVDYILITLSMKRTPHTKRISEIVLGHLYDLTGIKTTLSTAKTEKEGLLILIADRLAIWIDGMVRDILKRKVKPQKRPTTFYMTPVHEESRPETARSRSETIVCTVFADEESEEDTEEEEEEREEENEDEERVEEEEMIAEEEVIEGEEENIKEEEETNDEEEKINNEEGETEDKDEDQLEEPEDEEQYEAESEKESIEEWTEEAEIEMEEIGEAEEEFMEEEETEEVQEQVEDEEHTEPVPVEGKRITPAVIHPLVAVGRAFEVKTGSTSNGSECHYEIKQLSSTTVAKKVALAKGKEPTIIRKIPKTDSPLNIKSLKEWAKWAKEVVGTAEQWGHWLDKTIVGFEKRKLVQQKTAQDPSKAEAYNKEYSQWLKEQQAMYTAFRVEKRRIKKDVQQWDKNLENKIKHDSNPEVETNVHNL